MKRLFSIVLVLLFCFVMVLPIMASAAEKEKYVFYPRPQLFSSSYEFIADWDAGFYEGVIPEGYYDVYLFLNGENVYSSLNPLRIDYYLHPLGAMYCDFVYSFNNGDTGTGYLVDVYEEEGASLIVFEGADGMMRYPKYEIVLISAGPLEDDSVFLFDYVTSDTLNMVLESVVSLLPVVFGVIVGYIALRKAIAWLQNVLRSS